MIAHGGPSRRVRSGGLALVVAALAVVPAPRATSAQGAGPSGHWVGNIDTPGQPLAVEIDLKPGAAPSWVGTISIAAQNLKAFPLDSIVVDGQAVRFTMARVPGTPTFDGRLSADGATLAGDFTQGEMKTTFSLKRDGEARIVPPAKSTAIGKELEGEWRGTLHIGDRSLRLTLKLANGADGATGTMISVDQGGAEIPITTITQAGTHLELSLPQIAGSFSGDLKDGKLVGIWAQGPGKLPLEFSRP